MSSVKSHRESIKKKHERKKQMEGVMFGNAEEKRTLHQQHKTNAITEPEKDFVAKMAVLVHDNKPKEAWTLVLKMLCDKTLHPILKTRICFSHVLLHASTREFLVQTFVADAYHMDILLRVTEHCEAEQLPSVFLKCSTLWFLFGSSVFPKCLLLFPTDTSIDTAVAPYLVRVLVRLEALLKHIQRQNVNAGCIQSLRLLSTQFLDHVSQRKDALESEECSKIVDAVIKCACTVLTRFGTEFGVLSKNEVQKMIRTLRGCGKKRNALELLMVYIGMSTVTELVPSHVEQSEIGKFLLKVLLEEKQADYYAISWQCAEVLLQKMVAEQRAHFFFCKLVFTAISKHLVPWHGSNVSTGPMPVKMARLSQLGILSLCKDVEAVLKCSLSLDRVLLVAIERDIPTTVKNALAIISNLLETKESVAKSSRFLDSLVKDNLIARLVTILKATYDSPVKNQALQICSSLLEQSRGFTSKETLTYFEPLMLHDKMEEQGIYVAARDLTEQPMYAIEANKFLKLYSQ